MSRAAWGIVISVALMTPAAAWLLRSGPAPDAAVAQRFISPEGCNPEPGERAAFLELRWACPR